MGLRGIGSSRRFDAARILTRQGRYRIEPWRDDEKYPTRASKVIAFLEELPVTKGILTGSKMKLLEGQIEFVNAVYGNLRPNGNRVTSLAIKSEPKGNGKSGLVAGLCLCHLFGPEAELRGEVYSAAIDRAQASLIFNEMEATILSVPRYAERVNVIRHKKVIEVLWGRGEGSIYEALSQDARRAHGLAPTLFAYDELAQSHDRTLLDNLINGLGKRRQSLGLIISTQAPNDDHPLSQLIDSGLSGMAHGDLSTFVQLKAAPKDADIWNEQVWFACNEALDKFLSLDEFRNRAKNAREIPTFEPSFRNLRLNQRVDAREEMRICTVMVWKRGSAPVKVDKLRGKKCFGGLDLSGKDDLTACVLTFEPDENGIVDVLPYFWTPLGVLEKRKPLERDQFKLWIQQGHLIGLPGETIRYDFVAAELARIRSQFDLQLMGYDRWRIKDLKHELNDVGQEDFPFKEFGQGWRDMAPALDLMSELLAGSKLRHGMHPVLTACVANAVVVMDAAGNRKFDKDYNYQHNTIRIDGATALATALGVSREVVEKPVTKKFQMMFV